MGIKIPPSARTQEAIDTPLETGATRPESDFKSETVQEGMEEIDFRSETLEPTGFLSISEADVAFVDGTLTFTITPTGTDFTYYIRGCPFVKTVAENVTIGNLDGAWYIYYDNVGAGALSATQTEKEYDDPFTLVCIIYWNVSQAAAQWISDARSIVSMPWAIQRRYHNATGSQHERGPVAFKFQNFIENGNGTLDAHAQLGITGGKLYHEDVEWEIVHSAAPSNDFEQDIENIGQIPVLYREGADPGVWRKIPADNFALADDPGNLIFWNENNGGTWQLTNASNGNFITTYLFATTDPREPIIGVLGNIDGSSPLGSLDEPMLTPPGLPYEDFSFLGAAIFQTSTTFTNTPKARLATISSALFADSVDRYAILAAYNGNANTGRYLEMSPGQDSLVQPLLVPEDSFVRTVTLQSTQNINAGKSVGFFRSTDLVTPVFEVIVPVGGLQEHQFDVAEFFSKGDKVSVRVTDGNINKPVIRFWIETVP